MSIKYITCDESPGGWTYKEPDKVETDDLLIAWYCGEGIEPPEGFTELRLPWWRRLWNWMRRKPIHIATKIVS